jgi:indolepyruvate ferredoxin oxidoreductase alpha subunit
MDRLLTQRGGKAHLLLGNEAIVRGALEAGMGFATCYPGTPSSEVPDTLYRLRKLNPGKTHYYFEYSANEKVALEVAAGAASSGLRTLCTMMHVGLNVAADPLMTLAYAGVRAGMVILTADDPSMFSSQNEQDNRYYARFSGLPMLEPAGPAEAKEMTKIAFELSEELGVPVLLRTTTRVSHAREAVTFGGFNKPKTKATFEKSPFTLVPVPAVARNLHLRLLNIYDQAQAVSEKSPLNPMSGKGKLGVISSGVAAAYTEDAIGDLGLKTKVKHLKLGLSWPLPEKKMVRFLKGVDQVLIVEELEPLIENAVKTLAFDHGLSVKVQGKSKKHPQVSSDVAQPQVFTRAFEYTPGQVRGVLAKFAGVKYQAPKAVSIPDPPPLPGRPPNLCAGCSHRATYYAVKKASEGIDTVHPTDIGCYTLGFLPPLAMGDFLICMGSSVSSSCGFAKATDQKVISFIGDSTFFHSGMTGLANAVYNNHNFTLVILDNGTTAMTGHQPNPGVDTEALGDPTQHVDIEQVVRGLGVQHVSKIKPFKTKAAIQAVKKAVEFQGVSVVISEELCPLYAKRVAPKSKKPFRVSQKKCKKHMDCIQKVACPAMYVVDGQVQINELQCIGCALCAQVCPENAILPVQTKKA